MIIIYIYIFWLKRTSNMSTQFMSIFKCAQIYNSIHVRCVCVTWNIKYSLRLRAQIQCSNKNTNYMSLLYFRICLTWFLIFNNFNDMLWLVPFLPESFIFFTFPFYVSPLQLSIRLSSFFPLFRYFASYLYTCFPSHKKKNESTVNCLSICSATTTIKSRRETYISHSILIPAINKKKSNQ